MLLTPPGNLAGLLAKVQRFARGGASQGEVVQFVTEAAKACGVQVHYELLAPAPSEPAPGPAAEPPPAGGSPRPAEPAAEPAPTPSEPVEEPAAAPPGPAESPAGGQGPEPGGPAGGQGPEPGSGSPPGGKRRRKKKNRRERKAALVVPTARLADGSHCLDFGRLAEFGGRPAEEAPRAAADEFGRLVLCVGRRGRHNSPLSFECNGLVLDARTWRVLAAPPPAFNGRFRAAAVDAFLARGLYDLIRVDDGTIVTLYSWDRPGSGPEWCLASSNSYDVSALRWAGPRTYAEVFVELAGRAAPAFVEATGLRLERRRGEARIAFERPPPAGRCYSVGFRCHDFHPLAADPERMWLVRCADLAGPAPRPCAAQLPGLRAQVVAAGPAALTPEVLGALGLERKGPPAPLTVAELRRLGEDALEQARRFIAAAGPARPGPPAPELNYGLILRTRDPSQTGEHSDILLESPLLVQARRLFYERPPARLRDDVAPTERHEFAAMRAFLTPGDREPYLALRPDRAPRFAEFKEFTDNVVRAVVHEFRMQASGGALPPPGSATARVAAELGRHIRDREAGLVGSPRAEEVVRDYVLNPDHAFLYLRALAPLSPAQ